jgi:hypothetical protein
VDLNVKLRFWLQSDTFGKNRIGLNRIEYIWIQSDTFDEIWIHLETIGLDWIHLDTFKYNQKYLKHLDTFRYTPNHVVRVNLAKN